MGYLGVTMSREDAPNFRLLRTSKTCGNCKWGFYSDKRDWYCGLYDFNLDLKIDSDIDFVTCDSFVRFGEINEPR